MSRRITKLKDVIQPDIFTAYVINRTMELSALLTSGIIVNSEEFDKLASGPNTLVNMPFWGDLEGDEEDVEEGGFYTPGNIIASKDVARKQMFGNSWGANNLTALLSGDDPLAAICDLVGEYWARVLQRRLLAILAGIFSASTMEEKVHDISAQSGNSGLLTGDSFIDAGQKMGDAKELLKGVMMHSATEAYLAKRNLIKYEKESEGSDQVPYFMRKRVIVDDGLYYDTKGKTSEMYLFGPGAIALGNGKHEKIEETEVDRDSLSHAGEDYFVNRKIIIMHPRGVKWEEKAVEKNFPTRGELAKGDNWERVFEPKQIRIVKHKFRLA